MKSDEQLANINKEYARAVMDGDTEKAASLMRDARMLERKQYEERTPLSGAQKQRVLLAAQKALDVRYARVVDKLE